MNVIKSNLYNSISKEHNLSLGDLFLFENVAVIQVHEGMHVDIDSLQDCLEILYDFYEKRKKPFSLISNRINKYSIEVLDYPKYSSLFDNICMYGIIGYSSFSEMNISIEKRFSKMKTLTFNTLNEAFTYSNTVAQNKVSIN